MQLLKKTKRGKARPLKVKSHYQGNKEGKHIKVMVLAVVYWLDLLQYVLQCVTESRWHIGMHVTTFFLWWIVKGDKIFQGNWEDMLSM